MTPTQRWYRRQFHEQHLVATTEDVADAVLLIAAEGAKTATPFLKKETEGIVESSSGSSALLQTAEEGNAHETRIRQAAARVVDALVGTVDTSVSVSPSLYLTDIAPLLPAAVHAAVVTDLLVHRRESAWELFLLPEKLSQEQQPQTSSVLTASERSGSHSNHFNEAHLEQAFVKSIRFLAPSSSSDAAASAAVSNAVLEQCRAELAPIVTRYAMQDASLLLDEYDQMIKQQQQQQCGNASSSTPSSSPKAAAMACLLARLDQVFPVQQSTHNNSNSIIISDDVAVVPAVSDELQKQLPADHAPISASSSSSLLKHEQQQQQAHRIWARFIGDFCQRGEWLASLRLWAGLACRIAASSNSSNWSGYTEKEEEKKGKGEDASSRLSASLELYRKAVDDETAHRVATSWLHAGHWKWALRTLSTHHKLSSTTASSSASFSSRESHAEAALTLLLSQQQALLPSALCHAADLLLQISTARKMQQSRNQQQHKRRLLSFADRIATAINNNIPPGCLPLPAERHAAQKLLCLVSSNGGGGGKKNDRVENNNNNIELLCLAGEWQRAVLAFQEQQETHKTDRRTPPSAVTAATTTTEKKSFAQQVAAAGAPWAVVRQCVLHLSPAEQDARLVELVRCACLITLSGADPQGWQVALRLVAKRALEEKAKWKAKQQQQQQQKYLHHHQRGAAAAAATGSSTTALQLLLSTLLDNPAMVKKAREEGQGLLPVSVSFSATTLARCGDGDEELLARALEMAVSDDAATMSSSSSSSSSFASVSDLVQLQLSALKRTSANSRDTFLRLLTETRRRHGNCEALDVSCMMTMMMEEQEQQAEHQDPLCAFVHHSHRAMPAPFLRFDKMEKRQWRELMAVQVVVEGAEQHLPGAAASEFVDRHVIQPLLLSESAVAPTGFPFVFASPRQTLAVSRRVKNVVAEVSSSTAAREIIFCHVRFGDKNKNRKNRRITSSSFVAFEPRDELVMPPLSPWFASSSEAARATTAAAGTETISSVPSSFIQDAEFVSRAICEQQQYQPHSEARSNHVFALHHLIHTKRVNWLDAPSAQAVFEMLRRLVVRLDRASRSSNSALLVPAFLQLLHHFLELRAWHSLAGALQFAKREMKMTTIPVDTFARIVEATAFPSQADNKQAVAEVFAAVLELSAMMTTAPESSSFSSSAVLSTSTRDNSAAIIRAAAQRLASRSSHRSSWEEALAALDFAVVVRKHNMIVGNAPSSSSSSFSSLRFAEASTNPVVAQSAIWRLATSMTTAAGNEYNAELAMRVQAALWAYLAQLPQPLVMPRKLFDALMLSLEMNKDWAQCHLSACHYYRPSTTTSSSCSKGARSGDSIFAVSSPDTFAGRIATVSGNASSFASLRAIFRRGAQLQQQQQQHKNSCAHISLGWAQLACTTLSTAVAASSSSSSAPSLGLLHDWNISIRAAARLGLFSTVFSTALLPRVVSVFAHNNTHQKKTKQRDVAAAARKRAEILIQRCADAAKGDTGKVSNSNSVNTSSKSQQLDSNGSDAALMQQQQQQHAKTMKSKDLSLDIFLLGGAEEEDDEGEQAATFARPTAQNEQVDDGNVEAATTTTASSAQRSDIAPETVLEVLAQSGIETRTLLCVAASCAAARGVATPSADNGYCTGGGGAALQQAVLELIQSLDEKCSARQEQQQNDDAIGTPRLSRRRRSCRSRAGAPLNLLQQRQRYAAQAELLRSVGNEDEADLLTIVAGTRFKRV